MSDSVRPVHDLAVDHPPYQGPRGGIRRVSGGVCSAIMSGLAVSSLVDGDQASAFATLTLAFADDPFMRWLYPQPPTFLVHFPELIAAFAGRSFTSQTGWRLGEFSAVALWLPPGTESDGEAIVSLLTDTVPADRFDDLYPVIEAMDAAHPNYPHWYLSWLGVDVALQGQGLGSELMTPCLRLVDADHLPAYLETPNPRTIPFYERHGFLLIGKLEVSSARRSASWNDLRGRAQRTSSTARGGRR
jgi:ribosomal protein S18 acetylase RimI-like enzyme